MYVTLEPRTLNSLVFWFRSNCSSAVICFFFPSIWVLPNNVSVIEKPWSCWVLYEGYEFSGSFVTGLVYNLSSRAFTDLKIPFPLFGRDSWLFHAHISSLATSPHEFPYNAWRNKRRDWKKFLTLTWSSDISIVFLCSDSRTQVRYR